MKKRIIGMGMALIVCLSLSVSAMAAFMYDYEFSGTLPARQGDTEVAHVRRGTENDTWHFELQTATAGLKKVHAWTEGGLGDNYSSPSKTFSVGSGYSVDYDVKVPSDGQNVYLNLDNPNSVAYTVDVKWGDLICSICVMR